MYNTHKIARTRINLIKSSEEGACKCGDGHRRLTALTTLVILVVRNILSLVLTVGVK